MALTRTLVAAGLAAAALVGGSTAAFAAPKVGPIAEGSGNSHGVWCVQRAIDDWAYRTGHGWPLPTDGSFGVHTKWWVWYFQGQSGLTADSIVGPVTGDSLLDNLAKDGNQRRYCYTYLPSTY